MRTASWAVAQISKVMQDNGTDEDGEDLAQVSPEQ